MLWIARFSHWLLILSIVAASVSSARGDKPVFFDFSAGGFTEAEQIDIVNRVHQKYQFTWFETNVGQNLRFVRTDPGGNAQRVVFDNTRTDAGLWGEARGRTATVFAREVTHGRFRNEFANRAQQINAIVDTAAHELAHLKGCGHNCHAPANNRPVVQGKDGRNYAARAGDGTLVNNRPGLMADGTKVTPAERAAGGREFTTAEQRLIATFVRREKADRPVRPAPNPSRPDANICFIRGVYFDPTAPGSQPEWPEPYPVPDDNEHVSLMAAFTNNSAWDFGFETSDGGFMPLIEAGVSEGMISFEPSTIVNFAIRPVGAHIDDPGLSVADIGWIDSWSEVVSASLSIEPISIADYFRRARIVFDPDSNPNTANIEVSLFFDSHSPHYYDGIYPIPEPTTGLLMLLSCGMLCRRR